MAKEADKTVSPDELIYKLENKKPLPQQKQIILICGEEDYYRNQIMKLIPDYFFGDTPEADREISVFEKNTDLAVLNMAINAYPFFSGQSLVVLSDDRLWATRNKKADDKDSENENTEGGDVVKEEEQEAIASKKLEQLTVLIGDIPEYCTLVINAKNLDKRTKFYKQLKETALICSCDKLKYGQLQAWLYEQAELYKARFDNEAIGTIMEYIEPVKDDIPLGLLKKEIEKLAIYAGEHKQWTRADVLNIFASLPNASTFAIINSVSEGKLKESLEILAIEKKRGTNILPISAMIAYKLRQILRYLELKRNGYDQKAAMEELGFRNIYAMKFLIQYSRNFNEQRLKRALLDIADLNAAMRKYNFRTIGWDYEKLEEILVCLLR